MFEDEDDHENDVATFAGFVDTSPCRSFVVDPLTDHNTEGEPLTLCHTEVDGKVAEHATVLGSKERADPGARGIPSFRASRPVHAISLQAHEARLAIPHPGRVVDLRGTCTIG